jgi:protocatechuate 3,4-dioxygenase beta subunit
MPSDSKETDVGSPEANELRLGEDVPPTISYLSKPAWVTHIKKVLKTRQPESEEPVGPFFRADAPYRAKITLPYEAGTVLVIKGRVWAHDTKKPIGAKMDVWQANAAGRYDNEDPSYVHSPRSFINRARVHCDRNGYYEFETVHPGPYKRNGIWRAPHIHFRVQYPDYLTLVTQLFFSGDRYLNEDPYREDSLTTPLQKTVRNGSAYEEGHFDIVLTPEEHDR